MQLRRLDSALALVETGDSRYLRIDFAEHGAQTGDVRFADSAGSAALTMDGGAVASYVDDEIVAHRYGALGAEDPGFTPEPEPATRCEPDGTRCRFFAPTELAVNFKGTVVRSVKTHELVHPVRRHRDRDISRSRRGPGSATRMFSPGCGVSEVFSIETDPRGRFLVSGWGAPPAQAKFVRYTRKGRLDTSFGNDGVALGPALDTDNLLLPDPAFGDGGAFYTAFTQPRTPTLELRPVRFNAAGQFAHRFEKRSQTSSSTPLTESPTSTRL